MLKNVRWVRVCALAFWTALAMQPAYSFAEPLNSIKPSAANPGSERCVSFPVYHEAWRLVARRIYEPNDLKEWARKEHSVDCADRDSLDAMNSAASLVDNLGDDYTSFLYPDEVQQWRQMSAGEVVGVGISLQEGDRMAMRSNRLDKIEVASVLSGSPADKARIVSGDWILAIDAVPVSQIDLNLIAGKLDGDAGTKIVLTIARAGKSSDVALIRAPTSIPAVTDIAVVGRNLGYFKITNLLQETVSKEVDAAMQKLSSTALIILDLRHDHGGSIPRTVEVAQEFVEHGDLLKYRQRLESDPDDPQYATTVLTTDELSFETAVTHDPTVERSIIYAARVNSYRLRHRPIIVMVDEETASAAEILVGALSDNDVSSGGKEHVTLLGTTTFGKGKGQTVDLELPDGCGLKVTSFRFFSPRGYWVGDGQKNRHGYRPLYYVKRGAFGKGDVQFETAIWLGNRIVRSFSERPPYKSENKG